MNFGNTPLKQYIINYKYSFSFLKKIVKGNFQIQFDEFDFASCDYYQKNGKMLPDDWKDKIGSHDAIYFGAVGDPDKVERERIGWYVVFFFIIFTTLASLLYREYQKDYH